MLRAARRRLGLAGAGRNVTVRDDDVFVVSYPKSGNTWTRFLIGNLLRPEDPVTFANVEQRVPDIYKNTDRKLWRMPASRVLKSHEYLDPRYGNVVFVVRDPRDVALSYYHHHVRKRRIEEDYPLERYVSRFVSGDLNVFGSWGENVGGWLGARKEDARFLLLRYEDMLQCPAHELGRVAAFLSVRADEERLARAVESSSAERMRELERTESWKAAKKSREDRAFVRSATAGGWRTGLPEGSAAAIEEAWGPLMQELGYL